MAGLLIVAASTAACAFAQDYWQLLIFRGLGGAGSVMFTVASMALVVRLAPPESRGRVSGAYASAFLIGNVCGPVVGGLLAGFGLRVPFLAYAAALVLAALVVQTQLSHVPAASRPDGGTAPAMDASRRRCGTAPTGRRCSPASRNGWATFGVRMATVPLFAVAALHAGPESAGWALAMFAAGNAVALTFSGRLADSLGTETHDGLRAAGHGHRHGSHRLHAPTCSGSWSPPLSPASAQGCSVPAQQAAIADVIGNERSGGRVLAVFQMAADSGRDRRTGPGRAARGPAGLWLGVRRHGRRPGRGRRWLAAGPGDFPPAGGPQRLTRGVPVPRVELHRRTSLGCWEIPPRSWRSLYMPPTERSPEHTADNRPEDVGGTKRKTLRPAVVISVIAVIAVLASLVLFLRPAAGPDTAAPAESSAHVGRPGGGIASGPGRHLLQAGRPARRLAAGNGGTARGEGLQEPVGTSLTKGLVGISLEATDLADPALSSSNASTVKLLQEADQPVLRFGGNAVDRRFFWTSSNEPVPSPATRGDAAHPVRAVGPADLATAEHPAGGCRRDCQPHCGPGPLRPGPRRGHGQARRGDLRPEAAEHHGRQRAERIWGQWTSARAATAPGSTSEELKAYANAMNAVAPNVPISGPGAYDQKWWQPFIDADIPQKKILSFHNYPLYSCDGGDPKASPTIANLMSRLMHDRADDYQQAALAAGQAAGD